MATKQLGEGLILKTYDLLKYSIPTIERIPRKYKFTFGDRLHNLLSDLLEAMIEAYYSPKEDKLEKLRKINILLTKLRYFFRLGHDLNIYKAGHLAELASRVDEIGKRVGGWIKSIQKEQR